MKAHPDDTIAAVSTPQGRGAIGIVRLSGPRALEIAGLLAPGPPRDPPVRWKSHTLRRAVIRSGGREIDDALVAVMRGPRSYTGEDMAEFHCHGNPLVLARVVEACVREGARPALPGEFTRRAFLNGKMDLSQAEAVARIIEASSDRVLDLARRQAEGELGRRVEKLREALIGLLAEVEARLEFPEEDLGEGEPVAGRIALAAGEWRALAAAQAEGARADCGLRVAIGGKPNAGKSSIFNRLLGADRALVTADRGTTRDAIQEESALGGIKVRLTDTAGICDDHADAAGKASVERSVAALKEAELLIFVADGSKPWSIEDHAIARMTRGKIGLLVLNKKDLGLALDQAGYPAELAGWKRIAASAKEGQGMDEIKRHIIDEYQTLTDKVDGDSAIICSVQQADAIRRCGEAINEAVVLSSTEGLEELIAHELRIAWEALGEITGESAGSELLDKIFSRFCIGK